MDLRDLVKALLSYDAIAARQWIADARRARFAWSRVEEPAGLSHVERAVAAAVVELQANRSGEPPPAWTADIGALSTPLLLVRAASEMPRLRRTCERDGPEPLRRRNLLAPPEFLTIA